MAINKEKKVAIVKKLSDIFAKAKSVAFVKFGGLSVAQANELRKTLKEKSVGYFVAKKTLIHKALDSKKPEGKMPNLEGEIALAYLSGENDNLAPTREVSVFAKKFAQAVSLVGGIFEGKFIGKDEACSLAAIPSREILIAQFVNLVNSPIQRLAVVMNEIAKIKK